jgi:hypothetical protein
MARHNNPRRDNNKYALRRWKRRKRRANEARERRKAKAKVEQFKVAPQGKGA